MTCCVPPQSSARHHVEHLTALATSLANQLEQLEQSLKPAEAIVRLSGKKDEDKQLATLARHYLRMRRAREKRLPPHLFADPSWDMLLDLFASTIEKREVSVTDACLAASVPPTTALRWLGRLEQCGLVQRLADPQDGRRLYIRLSESALAAIRLWVKETFVPTHEPCAR